MQNSNKVAGLSDRKLYKWEGESLATGGSVEINAVFANPTEVSSYESHDVTQYPVPEELIPMIVQSVLQAEFNVMLRLNSRGPNNQVDENTAKGKQEPQ